MATEQWRDLHLLHVHRDTLRCAFTRCIACCYKIALHSRPGLLPNVRPEMCPRIAAKTKTSGDDDNDKDTATSTPVEDAAAGHRIGLYDAAQVKRILTVGDGNFSFSLALARALGPDSGVELVTTSHESNKTVLETYPDGEKILEELNAMSNVTVLHEVDATDAEQMKTLGQFDRVIWNFPCVRAPRGEDGQNEEMEKNKQLLHGFFAHVGQMLTTAGEIHVTHKTKKPFGQWGIENIAKENKIRHQQSVVFDRCLYPGYSNKKVLSKGSFPIWDSITFIFVREARAEVEPPVGGKENNVPVEPVTMDILKKVYLLLTPSLDDKLGSKKKRKRFSGPKAVINTDSQKSENTNDKSGSTNHKSGDNHNSSNKKRKPPAFCHSKAGKGRKKGRRS